MDESGVSTDESTKNVKEKIINKKKNKNSNEIGKPEGMSIETEESTKHTSRKSKVETTQNGISKNQKKQQRVKGKEKEARSVEILCPSCHVGENGDDWVLCSECNYWWHIHCSSYEEIGPFLCDLCAY